MAVLQASVNCERNERMESKKKRKQHKTSKETFLVAQDIRFAKVLASNNKKLRDKALKNLKKWFQSRSATLRKYDF